MSKEAGGNAKNVSLETLYTQVEALLKQHGARFLLALIRENPIIGEDFIFGCSNIKVTHLRETLKALSNRADVLHVFANVLAEALMELQPDELPLERLAAISTALLPLEGMAEVWEAVHQKRLNETAGEEAEEYEV
ncbi:MAG: hypothetical protein ACI353_07220 [Alloprevotella sp.]